MKVVRCNRKLFNFVLHCWKQHPKAVMDAMDTIYSIEKDLSFLVKITTEPNLVLLYATFYMHEYSSIETRSYRVFYITCFLLAVKYLDELETSFYQCARILHVDTEDICITEKKLLNVMDYNINPGFGKIELFFRRLIRYNSK